MPKTEPKWLHSPGPGRGWRVAWTLKDLLDPDAPDATTSPKVAAIARGLHDRIENLRVSSFGGRWKDDDEIESISDEFHTIGHVDGDAAADVNYLDVVLDALYTWADEERVLIR